MAVEQGLVMLVQANAAVLALCPVGGFLAELPKDQALPSWTYEFIGEDPIYVHGGGVGALVPALVEVRVYGVAVDVISLSRAIDKVLSGYHGTLPDPDSTVINGVFRVTRGPLDGFDPERRVNYRSFVYQVNYAAS